MSVDGVSHLPPVVPATTHTTSDQASPLDERAQHVASDRVERSRNNLQTDLALKKEAAVSGRNAAYTRRAGRRNQAAAQAAANLRAQKRTGAVGRRTEKSHAEKSARTESERDSFQQDVFVTPQVFASRRADAAAAGRLAVLTARARSLGISGVGVDSYIPPQSDDVRTAHKNGVTAEAKNVRVVKIDRTQRSLDGARDFAGQPGGHVPIPGDALSARDPEGDDVDSTNRNKADFVIDFRRPHSGFQAA
ncbi:MAG: hypothetical protein ACKVPX_05065 [Myxococcaceae bacterium]